MNPAKTAKVGLFVGIVLLISCTTDPSARKVKYLQSGEKYLQEGKPQEAAIELRNAIQVDPRFAAAHYQLGRAHLALGSSENAYREFREAVTLDPSNTDAELQFAGLLIARRQFDDALAAANHVLGLDPANAQAHTILGQRYAALHDLPNAIAEFQKAVQKDSHHYVEYYVVLGNLQMAAGQPSEAEATFKKAIEANPESAQAHVAMAQFYLARHATVGAESELQAACSVDAHAVLPRLLLGQYYVNLRKLKDAEGVFRQLKTIAPENPQAYRALGLFYQATGQQEKAIAEFESLASSKPKDTIVRSHLVEILLDLNRTDDAEKLNGDILKSNPGDALALLSEGRLFVLAGKYQEATVSLQKAIKSDPNSAAGYYWLGVAQRALGLLDSAKSSFVRAVQLRPQMAEASVALTALDVKSGDYNEAQRQADQALAMNPNLTQSYVAGAQVALAKGESGQAEALVAEALKRNPVSLSAWSMQIKLDINQGRAQDAAQRLSQLVQQNPRNAGLHFLLGVIYYNLKDLTKSEASVRQALALDSKTPEAHTLLANIAFARGAVEDGKSELRTAIAANPQNVANYMALCSQYEREGNWDAAKKLCQKAHEVDSNAPLVADELAFLYLEHGGDVNAALALAQQAARRLPNSPITADALGWAYYKLGATDSALLHLRASVQKMPGNPVFQYHLGMAYLASGQSASAQRSLEAALKTDPNFLYADSARTSLATISRRPRGMPRATVSQSVESPF
jgi:tetratricopeptide (TPR) repeat protein